MLRDDDFLPRLAPRHAKKRGWLGYDGAREAHIVATERRLGIQLPPSYRSFFMVTNGWSQLTSSIYQLWPVESIDWFRIKHQGWIDIWLQAYRTAVPVSDSEYCVYGADQYAARFRPAYLPMTVEISSVEEHAVYLLNPEVMTSDGEWEAWLLASWLPGAHRYRSFWELMQAEYQAFVTTRR